jgi:hypothetical protein
LPWHHWSNHRLAFDNVNCCWVIQHGCATVMSHRIVSAFQHL